ncbi:MAG TPA: hypothetical protein VND95_10715, partial [Stellaceae bacterium]|nr:hypothetical protein [Stellaceae bacterium]
MAIRSVRARGAHAAIVHHATPENRRKAPQRRRKSRRAGRRRRDFRSLEQISVKLIAAPFVIPGLDPGIHVDGRDKPGHDGKGDDSTGAELALA